METNAHNRRERVKDGWDLAPEVIGFLAMIMAADADEEPPEWQEQALCAETDPEAFFPTKGGTSEVAKRICMGCEVITECLEYALVHDKRVGVWGGLSERERRKLKSGGDGAKE